MLTTSSFRTALVPLLLIVALHAASYAQEGGGGGEPETFNAGDGRIFNDIEHYSLPLPFAAEVTIADPVFAATGEFVEEQTDLKVRSIREDFQFTRTWRSMMTYDGPLGRGWDFKYNQRVIAQVDTAGSRIENIVLIDGSGRRDTFYRFDLVPGQAPSDDYVPQLTLQSISAFEPEPAFLNPTPQQYQTQTHYFTPTKESGLTEVFEATSSTGELIRFVPGSGRVYYELVLRPDQLNPLNNSQRLNQITQMEWGQHPFLQPQVAGSVVNTPWHADDRYYRIKKSVDHFGNTTFFNYETHHPYGVRLSTDKLVEIVDTQGRTYDLTYYSNPSAQHSLGRLATLTDFEGRVLEYSYDSNGNLVEIKQLPGEALERRLLYTYTGPYNLLETRENPVEASHPTNRQPCLRNRYTGRRLLQQEYGPAAITPTMAGDAGNPGEPCYKIQYLQYWATPTLPVGWNSTGTVQPFPREIEFTDRTGTLRRYLFSDGGLMTSCEVVGSSRSYLTTYQWSAGRLVQTEHPKENPSSSGESGIIEEWVYDDQSPDPRRRGDLLEHTTYPETDSGSTGQERTVTELFADYEIDLGLPMTQTFVDGRTMSRTLSLEGQSGAYTGYLLTETITGRFGQMTTVMSTHQDSRGRLDYVVDAMGIVTTRTYETGTGNLIEERVDPSGLNVVRASAAFDDLGNAITVTNERGKTSTFVFDRLDRKIEEHLPGSEGYEIHTTYDANDRVTRVDLPVRPNVSTWIETDFDILGNVVETRRPVSGVQVSVVQNSYDASCRLVETIDPAGIPTEYEWTERSLLKRKIFAADHLVPIITEYTYDHQGQVVSSAEPGNVNPTAIVYDNMGRRAREELPNGAIREYEYDSAHLITTRTKDNSGTVYREVRKTYDGLGREIEVETLAKDAPGGTDIGDGWSSVNRGFDANDRVVSVVDELNNMATWAFDALGRVTYAVDPSGVLTTFEYDSGSSLVTAIERYDLIDQSFGGGTTIRRTEALYDDLGREITSTDANGEQTDLEYDYAGRVIRSQSPSGAIIETTYDLLGNAITISRAYVDGQTISYVSTEEAQFDQAGRLVQTENAVGIQTDYDYGDYGFLSRRGHEDSTEEFWSWDDDGRLASYTDQRESVHEYTYDSVGNLLALTVTPGSGVSSVGAVTTFQYDICSRQTSAHNGVAVVTCQYNTLGNVIAESQQVVGYGTLTFESTYNGMGQRTGLLLPTSTGTPTRALTWTRDANDRQASVFEVVGGVATSVVDAIGYEGNAGVVGVDFSNGLQLLIQRDLRGDVISKQYTLGTDAILESRAILNEIGLSVWRETAYGEGGSFYHTFLHKYVYDSLGRLEQRLVDVSDVSFAQAAVTPSAVPLVYADDEDFDWTAVDARDAVDRVVGDDEAFVYTAMLDLSEWSLASTTREMTYDLGGNRLEEIVGSTTEAEHTYDVFGRLVSTTLSTGETIDYRYDAMGRRVLVVRTHGASGATQVNGFDGTARAVECAWNGSALVDSKFNYYLDGQSSPFAQRLMSGAPGLYFNLADDLGSTCVVVDGAGVVEQHYRYTSAFGLVELYDGSGSSPESTLADLDTSTDFLFQGQAAELRVCHTRTYYGERRVFDASAQAYLQRDSGPPSAGSGSQPTAEQDGLHGSFAAPGKHGPVIPFSGEPKRGGGSGQVRMEPRPGQVGAGGPCGTCYIGKPELGAATGGKRGRTPWRYGPPSGPPPSPNGPAGGTAGGGDAAPQRSVLTRPERKAFRDRLADATGKSDEELESLTDLAEEVFLLEKAEAEAAGVDTAKAVTHVLITETDEGVRVDVIFIWDDLVLGGQYESYLNERGEVGLREAQPGTSGWDAVQGLLRLASSVSGAIGVVFPPALGVSVTCGLASAGISYFRGDTAGAAVDAAFSLIPVVGRAAGLGKAILGLAKVRVGAKALSHVMEVHTGAYNGTKSVFNAGEDIAALVRGARGVEGVAQNSGNIQRIVDAGRSIGIDRATGSLTSKYTVVTDDLGNLITAFPGLP